jgi:DNA-binding CsgD family transcriptional regulator
MAVLDLLLNGRTDRQIARELTMTMHRVQEIIRILCKQERCVDRLDLAKKLGSTTPQPLNQIQTARRRREIVKKYLLQDLSYSEIARETGIHRWLIYHDAQASYRAAGLPKNATPRASRAAYAQKMNVNLPPRFARDMPAMHELKSRILAGQSNSQIAAAMHLTYTAVAQRFFKLCNAEGVKGRKGLFEKCAKSQPSEGARGTKTFRAAEMSS